MAGLAAAVAQLQVPAAAFPREWSGARHFPGRPPASSPSVARRECSPAHAGPPAERSWAGGLLRTGQGASSVPGLWPGPAVLRIWPRRSGLGWAPSWGEVSAPGPELEACRAWLGPSLSSRPAQGARGQGPLPLSSRDVGQELRGAGCFWRGLETVDVTEPVSTAAAYGQAILSRPQA